MDMSSKFRLRPMTSPQSLQKTYQISALLKTKRSAHRNIQDSGFPFYGRVAIYSK